MGGIRRNSVLARLLERLEMHIYQSADRIVTLTEGVSQDLEARGITRDKICVIPNFSTFQHPGVKSHRDEVRKRYGFDGVVFVYTGSHGPANGLNQLLTGMRSTTPGEFTVCLVGDGVEKKALMNRVALEAIPNIRFLDPVPKDHVQDLLLGADFGLHILADVPVFEYGISPNKIFDYLAVGLPCITTTRGETGEFLTRLGAGVSVPFPNLVPTMRKFAASSPIERQVMARSGRKYASEAGSPASRRRQYEELLQQAVRSRGGYSRAN